MIPRSEWLHYIKWRIKNFFKGAVMWDDDGVEYGSDD